MQCWNNLKNELLTKNIQVNAPSSWNNSESQQGFGRTCRLWCRVSKMCFRPSSQPANIAVNIILLICSFAGWKRDDVSSCKGVSPKSYCTGGWNVRNFMRHTKCQKYGIISCELPETSRTSWWEHLVNKTLLWWRYSFDYSGPTTCGEIAQANKINKDIAAVNDLKIGRLYLLLL